jgi:hypothetical protein
MSTYLAQIQSEQALIEAMQSQVPFTVIGYIDGMIHVRLNGFWQIL